jgi:threonine dehydrogenase-like Zn-dependent dehydrogenase
MSVAYHSIMINAGGFQPGSNVAVVGAGPIGLSAAALCRAAGAAKIFLFDTNPGRLSFAESMGITDGCFNPMDFRSDHEIAGLLMELTHGLGCHINIEAAGNPGATYPMIAAIMASHAKLIQIGLPGKVPPIDLIPFIYHGTSIYCCSGSAGYDIFPGVLRMFAAGRLDMRDMISRRYPLEHTKAAIDDAACGTPGKVMVSQFY